jgi:hypothetical protein
MTGKYKALVAKTNKKKLLQAPPGLTELPTCELWRQNVRHKDE